MKSEVQVKFTAQCPAIEGTQQILWLSPVQRGDSEWRAVSQRGAGDAKPDAEPGGGQRSPQEPGEAPEAACSEHQYPPLPWR